MFNHSKHRFDQSKIEYESFEQRIFIDQYPIHSFRNQPLILCSRYDSFSSVSERQICESLFLAFKSWIWTRFEIRIFIDQYHIHFVYKSDLDALLKTVQIVRYVCVWNTRYIFKTLIVYVLFIDRYSIHLYESACS